MKSWIGLCASLLLSACGTMNEPAGDPPGFANGKSEHPYVKLGKPYEVFGKTYYPEHDPNYVEEGMASWYGPGFHGGKTANGERFNKMDMTAAHRTLPMPSVVKVTNLKNDKTVVVRINDRGPFAHNRIIDLSKRAAEELDMIRSGTAEVRVEYLPEATERYVAMLKSGYSPASISLEEVQTAAAEPDQLPIATRENLPPLPQQHQNAWWQGLSPIASAQAQESSAPVEVRPVPVKTTTTETLPPLDSASPPQGVPAWAKTPKPMPVAPVEASPFDVLKEDPAMGAAGASAPAPRLPAANAPSGFADAPAPAPASGYMVQLGVFGQKENAHQLAEKFKDTANVAVEPLENSDRILYRVRIGPFIDETAAIEMRDRARGIGVMDARVVR
jgi:rare lipoprotein A